MTKPAWLSEAIPWIEDQTDLELLRSIIKQTSSAFIDREEILVQKAKKKAVAKHRKALRKMMASKKKVLITGTWAGHGGTLGLLDSVGIRYIWIFPDRDHDTRYRYDLNEVSTDTSIIARHTAKKDQRFQRDIRKLFN